MIGKTLAHYTILEPLGAGGMGDVYLALDTRLNRKVALKTLQSDGERPTDQLTRLRREARAGAALNHPGVVTVYAVEESEGTVFITMEHVIGCTLRSLIEPGGMAVSTFRNITRQMASAVAAAHAAGVVHRDLKPGNVMLDKENQVKILDFGLARITEPEAAPADRTMSLSELTLPGSIMGTMPYMSPEQICGLTADARSDVFALGTVFYEMATGERPFAGQSVAELTSAIMRRTPRPICEARPGFPAGLVEVIDTCLHKEPEDRYSQAGELAEALARAPERSPVAATESNSELNKPLLGVLDFSNITGDPDSAWLATGIAESVTVDLNKFPEVRTRTREEMVAAWLNEDQQSQAAVMAVARNLGLDFLITGGYQKMGNRVRITGQVLDVSAGTVAGVVKLDGSMEEVFDLQDRILSGLLKSANLANISLKREALVPRGPGTLQAYELYSRAKGLLLDMGVKAFDDAEELLREALRLDPEYALAHTAFGHLRSMRFIATTDRRDLDEAIEHLEEARRVDPDLDEPLVWLTYCLGRLDRFEEAISVGEQAIALNPSRPQAHYFTGVAHWMRGASNYETGDWEAAARHLKRACKIQPTYQPAFMTRFDVLFRQGRWDEARRDAEFATEVETRGNWEVAAFYGAETQLGLLELAEDNVDEAEGHFMVSEQRLVTSTHVYAPLFLILNHCGLAEVAEARGEYSQAVSRIEQAQDLGKQHQRTLGMGRVLVRCGYALCSALVLAGRRDEAVEVDKETDRFFTARERFDFSGTWSTLDADLHMESARAKEALGHSESAATARQMAVTKGWVRG